jgi:hypothetical protein
VFVVNLRITVDNVLLALFIDGVRVRQSKLRNAARWTTADVIRIPATTRVIAVSARDRGVVAGILAEVSGDGLVTDKSWKCTTRAYSNWMKPNYDDTRWPAAIQGRRWKISAISSKAKWIWTAKYLSPRIDPRVYCRGHLSAYICRPTSSSLLNY